MLSIVNEVDPLIFLCVYFVCDTNMYFSNNMGGRHFKLPHLETNYSVEALNKATQQTHNEEDEVLKQL